MFGKQNISTQYSKALQKIRDFLLSKKCREFLIFLFFVFVSFCFWLLQVLDDEYETELKIPIGMKNVPENVVMTSELPSHLYVGVKDRGTVLANYMLGKSFSRVYLDFSEYVGKGNLVRIHSSELAKRISAQLNQTTKIQTFKPDTIEFIYTQGNGRKVPVKLQGEVKPERQYYISGITYSPDSVTVYAPKSVLDTLTAAYTEPLNEEGISDTLRRRLSLQSVKGTRFMPSHSDITLMVDIFSEKTVDVPVRGVGFPPNKVLRTFPSKVQVTFQVGLSHFKDITAEDFAVEVDYKNLENSVDDKCKPQLIVLSQHVNHARITPKEIDYIIEQQIVEP